ncbi:MAG TPA: hypothetical protein H9749_00625 [Candidatus Acutalibacter stercorigallinarum]|nr:hypothetical protein [Candidatus Acutalibacter stercorigallinarum]
MLGRSLCGKVVISHQIVEGVMEQRAVEQENSLVFPQTCRKILPHLLAGDLIFFHWNWPGGLVTEFPLLQLTLHWLGKQRASGPAVAHQLRPAHIPGVGRDFLPLPGIALADAFMFPFWEIGGTVKINGIFRVSLQIGCYGNPFCPEVFLQPLYHGGFSHPGDALYKN